VPSPRRTRTGIASGPNARRRYRQAMSWRAALFISVLLAVGLAAVGMVIETSTIHVLGLSEARSVERWPRPFRKDVSLTYRGSAIQAVAEGDRNLWYFAALAVLAVTLGALPLLRQRERARDVA
jgi:hypothetical protein